MEKPELEAVMTIDEIAEHLRVTTRTIQTYLYAGFFPGAYQLPGRHWRIPVSAFQGFVEKRRAPKKPTEGRKRRAEKDNATRLRKT